MDTNNTSTEEEPKPLQLNLNYPDKEILDVKIDRLRDKLLIPEETVREIIVHLSSGRHVLLAGPIGTGKSALAKLLGGFWAESEPHADAAGGYHCREFSANNDWSTQDVIGGIVPVLKSDDQKEDNGDVGYRYHEGCFLKTLKENLEIYTVKKREFLQDRPYDEVDDRVWTGSNKKGFMGTWLVIDELNRADIDKAFGPLLSALESRTLSVPDHPDPIYRNIPIPGNFRIIATLNTSDRHYLYKLSDALKRRFAYVEIKSPDLALRDEEIASAYFSAKSASGLAKEGDKPVPFPEIDERLKDNLIKCYEFLAAIRSVKDLGTAVLKSIYQTILMGTGKGGLDENSVLDAALTSNLIPQMDSLSEESLEMLSILYFEDDPVKSLDGIRGDIANRERFQKESGMFWQSMAVWSIDNTPGPEKYKTRPSVFGNTFSDDDWNATRAEFLNLGGKNPWKLPHFQAALAELKNQASM